MFAMTQPLKHNRTMVRYRPSELKELRTADTIGLMLLACATVVFAMVVELLTGLGVASTLLPFVLTAMWVMYLLGVSKYGGEQTAMRRWNGPSRVTVGGGAMDALAFILWPLITRKIASEQKSDREDSLNS